MKFRRPAKMEEQLDRELRFHLDRQTADLIARGHTPAEARRLARLEMGGPEQVKEECRDVRPTRWLEDLAQDLRYALRVLRQKPSFAAVALLTLGLGCGGATVMFTVIDGVLLKPVPYPHPSRLLQLQEKTRQATRFGNLWAFSYPNLVDCRDAVHSLDMAAWRFSPGTATIRGSVEVVSGSQITSNLFSVLGVHLAHGRAFTPEEDRPGAPPVIILSHAIWQRLFGGREDTIGTPLTVDEKPYTIVGIAPAGFHLNDQDPDIFTPMGQDRSPFMQSRARHPGINVAARLRPGAIVAAARTELEVAGRRLEEQYPASNKERTFVAKPLVPEVGDVGATLWMLLGAVTLVLLIACANVASLLLARAVSRQRELAMRVALGAGRGRLVRQCLTESAVLGLGGGMLGIALAAIGIRPFVALWPGGLPRAGEVHLDWRVLLFAVGASLLSGLIFGLAPAFRAPVRNVEQALRAGSRTVAGSSRLHGAFVICQIALAIVLLVSAGMLGQTMLRVSALNPGIDYRNVLSGRVALPPGALANPDRARAAWLDVLDRARRVPGVQAAAIVDTVPMREGNNEVGYWTSPAFPPIAQQPLALATTVTPEYIQVMGIPLLKGRFFDHRDRMGNQPAIVIDDVMAQQVFGREDPVGKRLWLAANGSPFGAANQQPDAVMVVGVVGHVRHWGLAGDDQAQVRAQFYYTFAQVADPLVRRWSELMSIVVRTGPDPLRAAEPLHRELNQGGGGQALYEVNTMEQLVSASLARQRFLLWLFGLFAALALLLACTGIYGVLAYLTNRRVPEIGVRIALGASGGEVMWLVLRQSLAMIAAGVLVGGAGSLAAARVLRRLVEGTTSSEPASFAVMIPLLVLAALLASYLPARRASRLDPLVALRQE